MARGEEVDDDLSDLTDPIALEETARSEKAAADEAGRGRVQAQEHGGGKREDALTRGAAMVNMASRSLMCGTAL